MNKIRRKTKKVSEKKAAEPSIKVDIIMLKDEIKEMRDKINKLELAVESLLAEPKPFKPVVSATPVTPTVPEKPLASRYDDVCKEIDKELKA